MPEDGGLEHDDHERAQKSARRSEAFTPVAEDLQAPTVIPSSPSLSDSLLGDSRLNGRGNAPVNAAVMRQMQRVYGNQATTRFLQALRENGSAGQTLQSTRPARGGQPPAADRAVQRFLYAQAQRRHTTVSASTSAPSPAPTHEVTQADPAPEQQANAQGAEYIQREQSATPRVWAVQAKQHAQTVPPVQRANGSPVPVQRGLWDDAARWGLERAAKAVGGDQLWNLLERAGAALGNIISDPGRFLGNLIAGVKGGFERFSQNISSHLKRGLKEWLFGQLGNTSLEVPQALDAPGVFSLVMQVLGLTAGRIREKLVKLVGAKEVQLIEKAWNGLQTLMSKGIGGLWAEMKEHLSDLKDTVMEDIKGWVISKVIQTAVIKIISMFNPASGLVAVIEMVWKVVQFVMERMSQLAALGQAVLDSVSAIASGNVGGVISKIEDVLSRSLSLVIGLLANLVGLGGIGQKIRDIINKVRTKVEGALDKVLKKVVEKVRSTLKRLTGGGKGEDTQQQGADTRTPQKKQADLDQAMLEAEKLVQDPKISSSAVKQKLPGIKSRYNMTSLVLVTESKTKDKEVVHLEGEINPKKKGPPATKSTDSDDSDELDAIRQKLVLRDSIKYFDEVVAKLGRVKALKQLKAEDARTAATHSRLVGIRASHNCGPNIGASPTVALLLGKVKGLGNVAYEGVSGGQGSTVADCAGKALLMNAISPTHAEGRALCQLAVAMKAEGLNGGEFTLYVDKPPCRSCKGAITVMIRDYGVTLAVVAPNF